MFKDFLSIALQNILHRKLRSVLTVVGIIIGIASIIALISVGQGLDNAIKEQFEKIGSNRIFVYPQGAGDPSTRTGIVDDDVDVLERMPEFEYVTPYLVDSINIEYANEKFFVNVIGFPDDDVEKRFGSYDITVEDGRYFVEGETKVALIGYAAAESMFDKEIRVNNNVKLNDVKFQVVGIFEEIGNPEDDNAIYIPLDDAKEILDKENELTMIDAVLKDGVDLDQTVRKAKRNLRRYRGNDNYEVVTPEQVLKQLGTITSIVQIVLVGIAFISLIVGAIGIMNSMYTSVLERTREIGIMKSIGASNGSIMIIFLIESGLMGLVGGIIGVALGSLIALGVSAGAQASGFKLLSIKINIWLLLFGIAFSFIVGALSGALPSRQASKLKPIDALRH